MTDETQTKINPLVAAATLVIIFLGILAYTQRDKWFGAEGVVAKVEPAPMAEAPKVAEPAKVEEAAKTAEPPKAEEPAPAPAATEKITPSFDTVRVEPNGETLVAGRAEPGSAITIKHNGATVGTTVANADGAFVVTTEKPLPPGPGALSIEAKNNDVVAMSTDTLAVDVKAGEGSTPLVAMLKPDEPTKIIQAPIAEKPVLPAMTTVNLDTVDYDEFGNIVFGGRGPAGSTVQIYVDNKLYGSAVINADGTWTMAGVAPLAVGAHELRADEIGADGAVKSRVGMPFFREDPAKVATAKPVAVPDAPVVVAAAEPAPAKPAVSAATSAVTEVVKTSEPAPVAEAPKVAEAKVAAEAPKVEEAPKVAEAPKVEEAPKVVAEPEAAVPAETAVAVATAEPPAPTTVVIQPGNNLWKLSREIYGKGIHYTVIYEANKDLIKNPRLIYPGQVFVTPNAPAAP
jgi:nucleoid-associated protein YgaU